MIESIFEKMEISIEGMKKKFYGVCTGRVINVLDPLMLGRVQVQLPFIDSLDLSPWARVASPMAGPLHGVYMIPNPGEEVLVAFEQGDTNAPYVIGSLWSAMNPPPLPSPVPQIRMIKTLAQNQIVITEVPPSIMIQVVTTGQTILISPAGIQMISGPNVVNLGPPAAPPSVQLMAGNDLVSMTPEGISVVSGGDVTVAAGGSLDLVGAEVNIVGGMVNIN